VKECLSSLRLAFHNGAVTVSPNPRSGFKALRRCGFILQEEVSVCCQGHLDYLVIVSLASSCGEPGMGLELLPAFLHGLFLHAFLLLPPFCES
jgi:hypothetical protein